MKLNWRKKQKKLILEKAVEGIDRIWKEKNHKYLREIQVFFDKVDNIEDKELRQNIISQMLICDEILTKIAEEKFNDFYIEGYKKGISLSDSSK